MENNLLFISREFPPQIGGAGFVCQEYINYFVTKQKKNILLFTDAISPRKLPTDFKMVQVWSIPKLEPFFFWLKLRRLNFKRFQAIIINDSGASLVPILFFPRELIKKCIYFLHGNEYDLFEKKGILFRFFQYKNRFSEFLLNCHQIVAVSNFVKDEFLAKTGLVLLKSKISVIHNGIEISNNPKQPYQDFSLKNSIGNKKIILTVARLVKEKGYFEMFELFAHIHTIDNSFNWLICGDGKFRVTLENLVKSAGLQDSVCFLGNVSRDQLGGVYRSAHVFLLLSNLKETFGLVYLEANSFGLPTIGYNKFGVREVIKNGFSGFLVESAAEAETILLHSLWKNLKKEDILSQAENFRIELSAKKLEAIICSQN